MDIEPREIADDEDGAFLSIADLLRQRKLSSATIATAIEKGGLFTYDKFDRQVVAGKKIIKKALDALERQHQWESESPMHRGAVQSPVDKWGDAWHVPYARCGWPTDKCPDFDALIAAGAQATKVGKSPKASPITSSWIMQVQKEAARRWTALAGGGANPTKNSMKEDLAKWCREEKVKTKTLIYPTAEYIYRHALRRWKPPTA